jgi:hypothetical protein
MGFFCCGGLLRRSPGLESKKKKIEIVRGGKTKTKERGATFYHTGERAREK